jgi:hypothetical protein
MLREYAPEHFFGFWDPPHSHVFVLTEPGLVFYDWR